jgi:outer membrane receptor protein involved in Fe transport
VANQLIYRTFDSVYFRPLYDSLTRVTGLHAELNYDKGEHLRTGTAVTINLFNTANTDSLTPNAFFLTPIRVDFFAAYKFLEDKLTARAELSLFGATPVGIDGEGELIRRNLFPNISVYGDYRITKGFSVYLWAGNLIGINYQRWLNYPERGFDIQGGITLAF